MAKQTVQGLILEKLDNLEGKVDSLIADKMPDLLVKVATLSEKAKQESKQTSRVHAMIWGGVSLVVSVTGLAIAYFK